MLVELLVGPSRMNYRPGSVRLGSGRDYALAEEALGFGSCKIDRYDYAGDGSDYAADETHIAAVDDLSYSQPYRNEVDYSAGQPGPFCSSKESRAERKAEDSEYDDYVRERDGSRGHSSENRGASEKG